MPRRTHELTALHDERDLITRRINRLSHMLATSRPGTLHADAILRDSLDELRQELHTVEQSIAMHGQRPRQIGDPLPGFNGQVNVTLVAREAARSPVARRLGLRLIRGGGAR